MKARWDLITISVGCLVAQSYIHLGIPEADSSGSPIELLRPQTRGLCAHKSFVFINPSRIAGGTSHRTGWHTSLTSTTAVIQSKNLPLPQLVKDMMVPQSSPMAWAPCLASLLPLQSNMRVQRKGPGVSSHCMVFP